MIKQINNLDFIETDLSAEIVSNIVGNDIRRLMAPKREHKGNREPTKIYLDKENKEFALRFGINLSTFFDNCLRELVEYLKGFKHAGGGIRTHASLTGHGLSRPAPYHSATPAQTY